MWEHGEDICGYVASESGIFLNTRSILDDTTRGGNGWDVDIWIGILGPLGTYQHGLVGCRGLDHSNGGNGRDCGIRFFLVLRKKFDDVSFFHMYYRVLNMRLVSTTKGFGFGFPRDKDLILLKLLYLLDFRLRQVGH